jgi:hypothetical protein
LSGIDSWAGLDVSGELQAVLGRALAVHAGDRFKPAEMSEALLATPEGVAGQALAPHELLTTRDRQPARGRMGVFRPVSNAHAQAAPDV